MGQLVPQDCLALGSAQFAPKIRRHDQLIAARGAKQHRPHVNRRAQRNWTRDVVRRGQLVPLPLPRVRRGGTAAQASQEQSVAEQPAEQMHGDPCGPDT